MAELHVGKAQRKAMAEVGASGPTAGWSDRVNDWFPVVHRMIAAANSIPDGAPVGTIARRPDGFWIAHMTESGWEYTELVTGTWRGPSADSWPVIFTPGEAVGSGPTTDGGETHDPTRDQGIQEYLEWSDTQINPDEEPDCGGDLCEDCIRWRTDPTAQQEPGESLARGLDDLAAGRVSRRDDYLEPQQEPERFPGIENPTPADHAGADNADEQLKLIFALQCIRVERGLSVAHVGEALGLEDSEVERFESGSTNPTMSMIRRYARAVEAVFTVDVRKWEDTQPQQEPALRERFPEQASAYVADPELAEVDNEPLPSGSLITPKPRTPRVVDRLGVDEQGARWRDRDGDEYWFNGHRWCDSGGSDGKYEYLQGYEPNMASPYTEVLPDVG